MISAGYDQIREYKKRARIRARFLYSKHHTLSAISREPAKVASGSGCFVNQGCCLRAGNPSRGKEIDGADGRHIRIYIRCARTPRIETRRTHTVGLLCREREIVRIR